MAEKAKTASHWLLWWQVGKDEIAAELEKYPSRNIFKTARGIAACCLLLSALITVAMAVFKVVAVTAAVDAVISVALAAFIYFGHRWAMLGAMAWWTIEKALVIVGGVQAVTPSAGQIFTQIIWWCVYLHAFWLAFRVEQARRKPAPVAA